MSDQTKDQIAAVMLQHGTPEQQADVLAYCKAPVTARPAPQGVALPPLTCSRSNRTDCALYESNRPSKEWYAQKIKETEGLDDTLPSGALAGNQLQAEPQGVAEVMRLVSDYCNVVFYADTEGDADPKIVRAAHVAVENALTTIVQERDWLRLDKQHRDSRIAEMEQDAARLDFLEARGLTLYECSHQERRPSTSAVVINELVYVFDGFAVGMSGKVKPTHREAIDAAIAAANQSSK